MRNFKAVLYLSQEDKRLAGALIVARLFYTLNALDLFPANKHFFHNGVRMTIERS